MPLNDLRANCLKCLGEAYTWDCCHICWKFKPCTKKDQEVRLMFLLMEEALRPSSEPSWPDLAPSVSTSVWSAPPTMRDSVLFLVPRKKHKKHLVKRGHSPIQKMAKHRKCSRVLPSRAIDSVVSGNRPASAGGTMRFQDYRSVVHPGGVHSSQRLAGTIDTAGVSDAGGQMGVCHLKLPLSTV